MKKIFIFTAILILGFTLRFWHLADFPEGVHIDEASRGYNAYSILKTGKDEYGRRLPFFFEAEGEYKTPVGVYLSALNYQMLGFSKLADRVFPAFLGVLEIAVFYFLFWEISASFKLSFLGMFLYAASYWTINFSRNSDTNQITLISIIAMALFLIRYLKTNKFKHLILTYVFAVAAVYSCRTSVVFVPIFLLLMFMIYRKKILHFTRLNLVFFAILSISILISARFIVQRFNSEGVNAFPEMVSILGEQIREDGAAHNVGFTRVFHNKIINWAKLIGKKYWENLDFTFWFFKGDVSLNNSVVSEPGFFQFEIILLLIGTYFLISKLKPGTYLYFVPAFIFIAPIANSVVIDSPSSSRMLIGSFGLFFLVALGIYRIPLIFKKGLGIIKILLIAAYFYGIAFLTHEYYVHKPVHQAWFRNYSLEEMIRYLEKNRSNYKKVYFSENIVTLYLFNARYDPNLLQSRLARTGNYNSQTKRMKIIYDNYGNKVCRSSEMEAQALFVCFGNKVPLQSDIVKVFRYRDSQPSYILVTYNPTIKPADREKIKLPAKVEFAD